MRRISFRVPSQRSRTIGAFSALSLTLATLAILHDGTEVADLELNDGGVWVTNLDLNGLQVAAHLNYPSRQLDANTKAIPGAGFDLSQEANAIVVSNAANELSAVTTATWVVDPAPAQLPDSFESSQGTDVVAIADPNQGKVWAVAASKVAAFDPDTTRPIVEGAVGVRVVAGKNDVIHAVLPDGTLRDLVADGQKWVAQDVGSTPEITDDDMQGLELTAAGGTGVVFNPADGWVAWPDHRTDVDGAKALFLQQPGADVGVVALAGPSGLVQVPLGGGDPTTLPAPAGGTPIRPVTVGECVYAAWLGTGAYLRDCRDDDGDVDVEPYPQLKVSEDLVFRTNRDVVVLNDPTNGDIFLVNENMQEISDWDTVLANLNQDKKDKKDKTVAIAERTDENNPPEPKNDEFGVRPGHSVTLPVLANDLDADGDILVARLDQKDLKGIGRLELVRDGRAVRITVDGEAARGGTATFSYTADDGRKDGKAPADVKVTVKGDEDNGKVEPLVPGRDVKLTIRERGAGEHHILQDWKDADGDPFWVSKVEYGEGLAGTYRPDGLVKVRDDGRSGLPANRVVKVTLTDGKVNGSHTIDFPVTVIPVTKKAKPVANADFVTTLPVDAGGDHAVTVRPLRNDVDPNGDDLYFSLVGKVPPGLSIVPNDDDSVTITSKKVGTQYVEYAVTDGSATVNSVIRVDTLAPEGARPVPDNDLAVLPPHGEVLIDVLSNDTDPLGGVLVVESVNVGQVSQVTAEVIDHEAIKLSDVNLVEGRSVDITYEVGNGAQTGSGTVTVVLDPARKPSAPVAADDTAVVRSGDVVTVDVLDNDLSPTDLPLEVLPLTDGSVTQGADLGEAWVSENKLRFKATGESGVVRIQYTVQDPDIRTHSATVGLNVIPISGANSAPDPKPLTGRLVQGGEAAIKVPLEGIDPDGDSVSLVGLDIDSPPAKGSVSFDGDTITYTAATGDRNRGTDTFGYVIEDEFNRQATGEVRVGIAAPPSNNLPPIAQLDQRRARPDRVLAVPATANDVDPEGGTLTILDEVKQVSGPSTPAELVDGRIRLVTPGEETTLTYRYSIKDDLGALSTADLVVEVSEEAPELPPIARDDRVPVTDIIKQTEVTVDVLRNDEDPDGAISELEPEVDVPGVGVTSDGQLAIPVKPERQVIVYRLTDPDKQVGRAVVIVPGSESLAAQRPVLKPGADFPIEVDAGTAVEIKLSDYLVVREGRKPSLPFSENIIPGPGHDGSKLKADDDLITFGAKGDFYGPTAVIATVSDASGTDDADALASTLTLPIFVNATGNTQPDLRVPAITTAPQEPWTGDLDLLATDPDPGDQERLDFSTDEVASGINVDLGDDKITVGPKDGTEPGQYLFDLVVSDGKTAEVRRTATVTVVESTRDKISVGDVELVVNAGEETVVDIEDYVTSNPFEAEGEPVELVAGPNLTAGDAKEIGADGLEVAIIPAEDFYGTLTATYVLGDATGLENRQVQGQISLNVRGRPSPPTTVTAEAGNAEVEVDWTGAEANGAPITGYRVEWQGTGGDNGEHTLNNAQTTYTATGLDNDTRYQFRVYAINEVGESLEASAWSREVTPDYVPATPAGVTVSFDSTALHVSWVQPAYDGSKIERYEINIDGRVIDAGSDLKETITGLTNGEVSKIKVRGINKAEAILPGSSPATPGASAWSLVVQEHPNTEPVVDTPNIVADAPDDDPSATISWTHADGGHPGERFEVRRAGAVVNCTGSLTASGGQCRVSLAGAGRDQQFEVRVYNRANAERGIDGWGPWSPSTPKVTGATTPDPVSDLAATPTGRDREVRIEFNYPDLNNADRVEFYASPGGRLIGDTSGPNYVFVLGGFTNGQNHNIEVTARTYANETLGGGAADSAPRSDGVSPFAPCTVSVTNPQSGTRSVTFDWRVTANGRDCHWWGDAAGNDPTGTAHGGSGTVSVSTTAGGSASLNVWADTQTSGQDPAVTRAHDSNSGRALNPTETWTDSGRTCSSTDTPSGWGSCRYVDLTLRGWNPRSTVRCTVSGTGGALNGNLTRVVDGDGNWGRGQTSFIFKPGGSQGPSDGVWHDLCTQQ